MTVYGLDSKAPRQGEKREPDSATSLLPPIPKQEPKSSQHLLTPLSIRSCTDDHQILNMEEQCHDNRDGHKCGWP